LFRPLPYRDPSRLVIVTNARGDNRLFLACTLVFVAIALAASLVPARRAWQLDPGMRCGPNSY